MATRILITGSRDWLDQQTIKAALDEHWDPVAVLVSGACRTGADMLCESYWTMRGGTVEQHEADWKRFGRAAGPMRNKHMVDLGADLCLAFLRGDSPGTTGTIGLARAAGIPVKVFRSPAASPG